MCIGITQCTADKQVSHAGKLADLTPMKEAYWASHTIPVRKTRNINNSNCILMVN
jgi:hypothetical protein